ncbi:protein of unknown function [Hyphomicrobium sp. MC1]|nr:protein of unknown function [Hyphomicrobium sp. MC1]
MKRRSRNNIGKELILDLGYPIFQDELLLFQPLDKKLVSRRVTFKGSDFGVELAMLGAQRDQLFPELAFVASLHAYSLSLPGSTVRRFWAIASRLASLPKREPGRPF